MKKTPKSRVRHNYRKKKTPALVLFAKKICTDMQSNSDIFINPKVPYDDILSSAAQTTISYNNHLKSWGLSTVIYKKDLETLLTLLDAQAEYVDSIAKSNVIIILDSGFDAVVYHNKITKHDCTYKQGASGEVINVLRKIKGAYCYVFQYCLFVDGEEPVWILADVTKKAKYIYKGLNPGSKYLFRYCPGVENTLQVWSRAHKMIVT